jgi:hypothetical protein
VQVSYDALLCSAVCRRSSCDDVLLAQWLCVAPSAPRHCLQCLHLQHLCACFRQVWGATPACNQTAPACRDSVTGKPVCCTADCEVLSTGFPQWSLLDTHNALYGGLMLKGVTIRCLGLVTLVVCCFQVDRPQPLPVQSTDWYAAEKPRDMMVFPLIVCRSTPASWSTYRDA